MSESFSETSSHSSITLESSPDFESLPQTPVNSNGPHGLSIVTSQQLQLIFFLKFQDNIPAFLEWWRTTPYAQKLMKPFVWNSSTWKSYVWEHFEKAALYVNGHPKIHCCQCKQIYSHSSAGNLRTHALDLHLKELKCSSFLSIMPTAIRENIFSLLKQGVSLLLT